MNNQNDDMHDNKETIFSQILHTFEKIHDRAGAVHYPKVPEEIVDRPNENLGFLRKWSFGNKDMDKPSNYVEKTSKSLDMKRQYSGLPDKSTKLIEASDQELEEEGKVEPYNYGFSL